MLQLTAEQKCQLLRLFAPWCLLALPRVGIAPIRRLSIHPSTRPSVCPPPLSVRPFVRPFGPPSVRPAFRPSVRHQRLGFHPTPRMPPNPKTKIFECISKHCLYVFYYEVWVEIRQQILKNRLIGHPKLGAYAVYRMIIDDASSSFETPFMQAVIKNI